MVDINRIFPDARTPEDDFNTAMQEAARANAHAAELLDRLSEQTAELRRHHAVIEDLRRQQGPAPLPWTPVLLRIVGALFLAFLLSVIFLQAIR